MNEATSRERRRYPRFSIEWPVVVHAGDTVIPGQTVNLSLVGAYVLLEGSVGEFSDITLRVALPVTLADASVESFTIELPGVVVREENAGPRHAAAFMFTEVPVESEWVLAKFLLNQIENAQT